MTNIPPPITTTPPPRRWFRFSLRTLLLVMTVLPCGLAWVANERAKARTQIEGLRKAGFSLSWSARSTWSRMLWGDVLPSDIHSLTGFADGFPTEENLAHLRGLANLHHLTIRHPSFRGAGLENLQGNGRLRELILDHVPWTDDDLVHLEGLSQVRMLFLFNTHVSATGIKNLQRALPHCTIYVIPTAADSPR